MHLSDHMQCFSIRRNPGGADLPAPFVRMPLRVSRRNPGGAGFARGLSSIVRLLPVLCAALWATRAAAAEPLPGMTDTASYFPRLRGHRIAVLTNHTAVAQMPGAPGADAGGRVHLVDLLHGCGFDVTVLFSPEHGFRGTADAGQHVADSVDVRTGIPIRSLYDGRTKRPSAATMRAFDLLLVDMQDVGLRFYTYHISMLRMMEACADSGYAVVVLDRPNPNGHLVDGPLLEPKFRSGVGMLPVPVLHGLTMGEIARMAGASQFAPSPNLPTQRAVYLYASLCPFEGTVVSLGRGTDRPFECYGHPEMTGCDFVFTPHPTAGAARPPLEGRRCRGVDLSGMPLAEARDMGLNLGYVIHACRTLGLSER